MHTTPLYFYPIQGAYLVVVILLVLFLLYSFVFSSTLLFYISFESILIPTSILIVGWGSQPERIQAGLYFIFYTVTASIPLLLVVSTRGGFYMSYLSLAGSPPFVGFTLKVLVIITMGV